jgi:hypothetical protein
MLSFAAKLLGASDKTDDALLSEAWRRRNFCGDLVPADPAGDPRYDAVKGDLFEAGQCYFSVRLVEMRLAQAGNYVAAFLPMCCCFLRYTYGGSPREVPFIVGYDLIRSALGSRDPTANGATSGTTSGAVDGAQSGSQHIEFKNIYIVRDAPLMGNGVVLYVALCRLADNSFTRGMLDLVADAAGMIGGPAAGLVAHAGADMTKRLGKLLGAQGVTTRFGIYDGDALRASGYRVFAGAGAEALQASELSIDGGQLRSKRANGETATIDDLDYLVVAFEYRKTLVGDAFGANSTLPFAASWNRVKQGLLAGGTMAADEPFKRLMTDIAVSYDLIEADRIVLIQTYLAQLDQWKALASAASGATNAVRSTYTGPSVAASLGAAAQDRMTSAKVRELLNEASAQIGRKAGTPTVDALSEEALSTKAAAIRTRIDASNADTKALAKAAAKIVAVALNSPL